MAILPAIIWEQVGGMDKGSEHKHISFTLASDFLHAVSSYDMGPLALLPIQRKMCCGF
jgi:hypothetical protein